jgi:hypothetical protein
MALKRLCAAFVVVLALALAVSAQNLTAVSATVTDPNGIPYANGTVLFTLGPLPFTTSPTLPTTPPTPVAGTLGPFPLSIAGVLNVNLPSNAAITPGSTQWTPTVCSQAGSGHLDQPIAGNCFTAAAITISGASQDISVQLAAAALPLIQRVNVGRLFSALPAAGTSSLTATTMVTAPTIPAAGTSYRLSGYISQTVLGASCAGNTTIVLNAIFQDPAAAAPQTSGMATFTVTTNGTLGIVPITAELGNPFMIRAKAGTVVQYSTTYTPGGSCSPAPAVQVYPVLEQM